MHKEKVSRREIGVFTAVRRVPRSHKILPPSQPPAGTQPRPPYSRRPINYQQLDGLGHGMKVCLTHRHNSELSVSFCLFVVCKPELHKFHHRTFTVVQLVRNRRECWCESVGSRKVKDSSSTRRSQNKNRSRSEVLKQRLLWRTRWQEVKPLQWTTRQKWSCSQSSSLKLQLSSLNWDSDATVEGSAGLIPPQSQACSCTAADYRDLLRMTEDCWGWLRTAEDDWGLQRMTEDCCRLSPELSQIKLFQISI